MDKHSGTCDRRAVGLGMVALAAGMNNGMTWGFTAHFDKFANRYSVDSEGTRGVEYIRVVDDCEERVISPDCGMLLTGVI